MSSQDPDEHLEKGLVVAIIQGGEEGAQMGHGVYDCKDFWSIHHLLLEGHPVQCYEAGDDCVEDALLVGEQLCPAAKPASESALQSRAKA